MRSIQNVEIGLKPTPNILIITDETVHTCNDKHIWLEISPDSWPVIYIYIHNHDNRTRSKKSKCCISKPFIHCFGSNNFFQHSEHTRDIIM